MNRFPSFLAAVLAAATLTAQEPPAAPAPPATPATPAAPVSLINAEWKKITDGSNKAVF